MERSKSEHNTIEKILFGVGIIVLLSLFGYLTFQIFKQKKAGDKAPQIEVLIIYRPEMDDYTFEIEVKNQGNESAEDVHLKLELYQNGKVAETGNTTFKYVPVKSKKSAFIVFNKKRTGSDSLVVASKSFNRP